MTFIRNDPRSVNGQRNQIKTGSFEFSASTIKDATLVEELPGGTSSEDETSHDGRDVPEELLKKKRRQLIASRQGLKQPAATFKIIYLTVSTGPRADRYRCSLRHDARWDLLKQTVESRLSLPPGVAEVESLRSTSDGSLLRHAEDIMDGENVTVRIKMLHPPQPEKGRQRMYAAPALDRTTLKVLSKKWSASTAVQEAAEQQLEPPPQQQQWIHSTNANSKSLRNSSAYAAPPFGKVPLQWVEEANDRQQHQQRQRPASAPVRRPEGGRSGGRGDHQRGGGDRGAAAGRPATAAAHGRRTNHEKVSEFLDGGNGRSDSSVNRRSGSNGRSDGDGRAVRRQQERGQRMMRRPQSTSAATTSSGRRRSSSSSSNNNNNNNNIDNNYHNNLGAATATTATAGGGVLVPPHRMDVRQKQMFRQMSDPDGRGGLRGGRPREVPSDYAHYRAQEKVRAEQRERFRQLDLAEYEAAEKVRAKQRAADRELRRLQRSWGLDVGGEDDDDDDGGGGGGGRDGGGDEPATTAPAASAADYSAELLLTSAPATTTTVVAAADEKRQQQGGAASGDGGGGGEVVAESSGPPRRSGQRAPFPVPAMKPPSADHDGGWRRPVAATKAVARLRRPASAGPGGGDGGRRTTTATTTRSARMVSGEKPAWKPTRMCSGGRSMKTFSELYPMYLHDGHGGPSLTRAHHKFTYGGTSGH